MADIDDATASNLDADLEQYKWSLQLFFNIMRDRADIRRNKAHALGSRASPPESFPEVVMRGFMDVLKWEYVDAVAAARLRLDDLRSMDRQCLWTLEKPQVTEAARNLANCSLVHTTWHLPARNALGSILWCSEVPVMYQITNPVFARSTTTTEVHIQLNWTSPEPHPTHQLFLLLHMLPNLTYLDLDLSKYGDLTSDFVVLLESLDDTSKDPFEPGPSLESLVIRGAKMTVESRDVLEKILEMPHSSLKSITFVLFSFTEYVNFNAANPDEALLPPSLSRSIHRGALERFYLLDRLFVEMRTGFSPQIVKFSCGRTPSGTFAFDEMTTAVVRNFPGDGDLHPMGHQFLSQVRNLVLECDSWEYDENVAKKLIEFTRNLTKLHIRIRLADATPFDALAALPSSVKDLSITLADGAEKRGLKDWDEKIRGGLAQIAHSVNLDVFHICVAPCFRNVSFPECDEWCTQKGVTFVATLGGRNLYL